MTKYHFIDFLHVGEGRLNDGSGQNCTQTIDKRTIGEPIECPKSSRLAFSDQRSSKDMRSTGLKRPDNFTESGSRVKHVLKDILSEVQNQSSHHRNSSFRDLRSEFHSRRTPPLRFTLRSGKGLPAFTNASLELWGDARWKERFVAAGCV